MDDDYEMPTDTGGIFTETCERDGINYVIAIRQIGDGFWAHWRCSDCDLDSESSQRCSSKEDAFELAKTSLDTHHESEHG